MQLLHQAVQWYHLSLSHLGQNCLFETMQKHLHHPDLRIHTSEVVTHCNACQRHKNVLQGHGHTAPREAAMHPWKEVAIGLIGPWKLNFQGQEQSFIALTIIDLVTNLAEIIRLDNKTSAHVALQFENTWLPCYPRPLHCMYDQGGEFVGWPFQQMLSKHGIHCHPTTAKNPPIQCYM